MVIYCPLKWERSRMRDSLSSKVYWGTMASLLLSVQSLALAQMNFPTRPIRITTPFAPGGSTWVIAGVIGQKLTERWG